jgi:hypothetical protein
MPLIAEVKAGRIGNLNCIKPQSTFFVISTLATQEKIAGITICYTEN